MHIVFILNKMHLTANSRSYKPVCSNLMQCHFALKCLFVGNIPGLSVNLLVLGKQWPRKIYKKALNFFFKWSHYQLGKFGHFDSSLFFFTFANWSLLDTWLVLIMSYSPVNLVTLFPLFSCVNQHFIHLPRLEHQ